MNRTAKILAVVTTLTAFSSTAWATNGDNMLAVGPNARAMGGVGLANPQDAISAVFDNPAAMCFGPYCPQSQFDFAGTLFMPHVDTKVSNAGGTYKAEGHETIFAIPAIGLSVPFGGDKPEEMKWRFGLAAYGVSGLGVDYRNTDVDRPIGGAGSPPLIAGKYSNLQIMKFAPSLSYRLTPNMSVGAAMHVDYATLDLGEGSSSGYGIGAQPGFIYKMTDDLSLGFSYISPQEVSHDRVTDFDGDGSMDTLKLEAPQRVGVGIAYELFKKRLLLEVDGRWVNWSGANGYDDFDWEDQWIVGVGGQYAVLPEKLFLRAGYSYGNNPVNEHNNWAAGSTTSVQGKNIPTYYYETFRIVGFPAVIEHHVTLGFGYNVTDNFSLNLGYMHAFENSISEQGPDVLGNPARIESSLSEDSLEFGLSWRF
ncbi:MAG: outer membrane protein transport protein [Verrucomicrobia bacterium]|nr:outer membrane protein transport protein [Verrucomicrobiota bacterium]MCF7708004.1 outer membrane protein transport protein [Verrucomicrobiota bacterium]